MPATYEPRRGRANTTYLFVDADGRVRQLEADDDGVIHPRNEQEQAFADRQGFPVARKVQQAEQAAEKKEA